MELLANARASPSPYNKILYEFLIFLAMLLVMRIEDKICHPTNQSKIRCEDCEPHKYKLFDFCV